MNYDLFSTSYFPPISYIRALIKSKNPFMEQYENFTKKTFRNRCKIYSSNGVINLTVPIVKSEKNKQIIKDCKIDYSGNWQKQHFKSLEAAYKSSPFYLYLIDDYSIFFTKKYKYLLDYNLQILQTILDFLDFKINIQLSDSYIVNSELCNDLRYLSNRKNFDNIYVNDKEYYQVFADKHGFQKDLSIIDLIFNTGNEAYFSL